MIECLIKAVFEKARIQTGNESKNGRAKHLEDLFNHQFSSKTLVRYYDAFVLHKKEHLNANSDLLNAMSQYLGYTNYENFVIQNKGTPEACHNSENRESSIKNTFVEKPIFYVISMIILGLSSYNTFFPIEKGHPVSCAKEHYKVITCNSKDHYHDPPLVLIINNNFTDHPEEIPISQISPETNCSYTVEHIDLKFLTRYGIYWITQNDFNEVSKFVVNRYLTSGFDTNIPQDNKTDLKQFDN